MKEKEYYYVYRIDHFDWDDPEYYDTREEADEAINHHHSCSMNPYYVRPIEVKKLKRRMK